MSTITPFRYAGGKSKLLPILMNNLDGIIKNTFIDAFIGGGSVLLTVAKKYPNIKLYANDKDYWIYCFWKIISDKSTSPYNELLNLINQPPTIEQFYKLREEQTREEVGCAYRGIFFNRTAFSGILHSGPIGGKEQKGRYKVNCRYNAEKLLLKIKECRQLLIGRTTITNYNFINYKMLTESNEAIYLDPPYYKAGDSLYYEKMNDNDHFNLSIILFNRDNWVLSYDDCLEVRNMYDQHNIIDLSARYCINGVKKTWKNKNELLIVSTS